MGLFGNPLRWLMRHLEGMKRGSKDASAAEQVLDPLARELLINNGLPTTSQGAAQLLACHAAEGFLTLAQADALQIAAKH